MERRTVLAFFLIFVVLVGYQILMSRIAPPPPAPASVETTAHDPARPTGPAPAVGASSPTLPESPPAAADAGATSLELALAPADAGADEARVVVRTPLYEVTLAGRGARITSWRGLQYTHGDDEPVEIIPQGDLAVPYGMDAVVFNATDLELGQLLFTTAAPARLDLNEGTRSVVFTLRTRGDLEVRKIYTFDAESYELKLDLEVAAVGSQAATTRALLGTPRQVRFGWPQGIASTEGGDRLEMAAFRSFAKVGDELHLKRRGGLAKNVDKVHGVFSGAVSFAGVENKYFIVAGLPGQAGQLPDGTVILSGDQPRNLQTWSMELPLTTGNAGSGAFAASRIALYLGPQESDLLKAYGVGLDKTMELGWALFRPLTEATLWIMYQLRRFIPNWGLIIILFSVLTKLAFYPLTKSSTESMKRMQQLQPKIKELQEKYKDNQEKQSKAMMELYSKEKVNPMAGCLPLLLQMPVFVALYQALAHTIALRNTPFVGWIKDLSQPDALFTMPFSLPFLGPDFNLLPLLMTGTMVVQQRLTPTATTGGQMAMMNTMMPIVFLFFFYQMPSGLVLYWLVNNVMTIVQTWRIHRSATSDGGQQTA
ncbi:MAG: membrane protein insertase YidC [Candidatus Krumholzibacteriia bacterium]